MITLNQINAVQTLEDLENLGIGRVYYDLSYRGGTIGISGAQVADVFGVKVSDLPRNFGAHCNYLGGGLRGSIVGSGFNKNVTKVQAAKLTALSEACIRVYEWLENQAHLNDEEDGDGNTNWEALGTARCWEAGVVSAY